MGSAVISSSDPGPGIVTEGILAFTPVGRLPTIRPITEIAFLDRTESGQRANERIKRTTDQRFRQTVSGYASVTPESSNIRIINGTSIPVLYPIWLITTKKEGKTYTFAINGQSGELTCDIPWSKAKFFGRMASMALGIAAAAFVVIYALGAAGVFQ